MSKNKHKKSLLWIFKIAFLVFLFFMLSKSNYLDSESLCHALSSLNCFIPALFLLFFGIVASGLRWWILLKISDISLQFKTTIFIQLIGNFFSTYLPGAVGGDVVRGLYLYKYIDKDKGRNIALLTIFIDRIFALCSLLFLAFLMSLYFIFIPGSHSDVICDYIRFICEILTWGSILFFAAMFFMILICKLNIMRYLSVKLASYIPALKMLVKMYLKNWPALILCTIISLIASLAVVLGIVFIGSLFSFAPLPQISAIAGVLGNVFSAIPITPGGLGIGEAIFAKICTDLSGIIAPYASIYLTFRVGMLFSNIPGAFLLIFWKKNFQMKLLKLT